MIIKHVDGLPEKNAHGRTHKDNIGELLLAIEGMRMDEWYQVMGCPYNNANDQYRAICKASEALSYPVEVKMRRGNIYLRRTR